MSLSTKRDYPLRKRKDCPASKKPTPFTKEESVESSILPFSCRWCTFRCQVQHVLTAHLKVHNLYTKCSVDGCTFSTKETHDKHIQMKDQDSLNDNSPLPLKNSVELNTNNIVPTTPNTSKRSDNSKRFVCEKNCGYATDRNSNLQVHIRRHTGEKPYACDFEGCSYRSVAKDGLKQHQHVHTGEKPHRSVTKDYRLKKHQHRHLRENKPKAKPPSKSAMFVCEYCDQAIKGKASYLNHIRRHTGEKRYACDYGQCSFRFVTSMELKHHKYRHYPETKPFKCDQCSFGTLKKHILQEHKLTHVKTKSFDFNCNQCTFQTTSASNLKCHRRRNHVVRRRRMCKLCPFRSKDLKTVTKHELKHSGTGSSCCCQCTYRCQSQSALTRHLKWHNVYKMCSVNGCRFSAKETHEAHLKMKAQELQLEETDSEQDAEDSSEGESSDSEGEDTLEDTGVGLEKVKCSKYTISNKYSSANVFVVLKKLNS